MNDRVSFKEHENRSHSCIKNGGSTVRLIHQIILNILS